MEIKYRQVYGNQGFDEVSQPKAIYTFDQQRIIAVYHTYYGQWPGRHLNLYQKCLSLYEMNSLQLITHLDTFRYPINDLDIHPEKNLMLIATGSYDGGCFFEGELFLLNLKTGTLHKIVSDNRDFIQCQFIEEEIELMVHPIQDLDNDDLTSKVYRIPVEENQVFQLSNLQPLKVFPYGEEDFGNREEQKDKNSPKKQLTDLGNRYNKHYQHKALAWDLTFINDQYLAIGYSDARLGLLDIAKNHLDLIAVAEQGDCVQLFKNQYSEKLIVNIANREIFASNVNTLYAFDLVTHNTTLLKKGSFILSKTKNDEYLARQTGYKDENRNDIVWDPTFQPTFEGRLGHYDIFNHYLRIDNCDKLYALVGNPREQHQNKQLIEITPRLNTQLYLFHIEQQPHHFNNLNAILIDDIFCIEAEIYHPTLYPGKHLLKAIKKDGSILWEKNLNHQSTGMTAIKAYPGHVAIAFTSGEIWIIHIFSGAVTLNIPQQKKVRGYPLSIANFNNKLAIGYDNGLIEVLELISS